MHFYRNSRKTFFQAVLAVGALAALTACEFGNKLKIEQTGYDVISGYYTTQPQSVSFRATIGTGPERTRNGLVAEIPAFLRFLMKNPTALNFVDPIQGIGAIQAREDSGVYLVTQVQEKAGTFGSSSTARAVLADCELREEIVHTGSFRQTNTHEVAGVTARGQIGLDYTRTYSLVGLESDCQTIRDDFRDCYVSGTNCSADPLSIFHIDFIRGVFDPFISNGMMTGAEIGAFKSITYRAVYE